MDAEVIRKFMALHSGLDIAFGTGDRPGRWIKRPPTADDFARHLRGEGNGIGIAPLRPDNHVMFAAIDLDEPDFAAAREMQSYIPGASWLERSRSGNAHVLVYFKEPLEAWIAMGMLKAATEAAGKPSVEVFPKNWDFERVRLGNYINLSFHGDQRPILNPQEGERNLTLEEFVTEATALRTDPRDWRKRAAFLMLEDPSKRERSQEFGEQANLHICADHILSGDAGLIPHGHQNNVLFMLSKALTNWKSCDHDEALMLLRSAAAELFVPTPPDAEVQRVLANVERAQYTSTGCDDPLVQPFTHPNCPIAHPRSR